MGTPCLTYALSVCPCSATSTCPPAGRVCGLALLHGAPLPGFHLTRPLRRLMLHHDLDSDDLHSVDAQMASALQVRLCLHATQWLLVGGGGLNMAC